VIGSNIAQAIFSLIQNLQYDFAVKEHGDLDYFLGAEAVSILEGLLLS